MTDRIYLNNDWTFYHEDDPENREQVRIPHTNVVTPFNYYDEHIYQFVSVYEKNVNVPEELSGKLLWLTFEGAAHKAEVYVNDKLMCTHMCGYTEFKVEISKAVEFGADNNIRVVLDSRETLNVPPFGHVIDYLTYGGIYREVYIDVTERTYISDVFVYTKELGTYHANTAIKTAGGPDLDLSLSFAVLKDGKELYKETTVSVGIGINSRDFDGSSLEIWDLDHPNVYTLRAILKCRDEVIDTVDTDFAIRTARFEKDGFYLNGSKIKLRGLNRHQSWPYVGYAMPQSAQEYDVHVLKEKLCVNAVRTSHYPQSKYFLDACDREGLIVFTEAPGWQNIGDDDWKAQHLDNVRDMVLQNRNHPSIVLWGVRINESMDDNPLYKKANALARELDPSRQTSGVRFMPFSNLLEDVYAYNDFSHTGNNAGVMKKELISPRACKPYLVSEHNGHMFPTKSYDCEEHRLSQARRHARVMDDMYAPKNGISGAFGWCMFDYNTHKDFGSGDRICYHGVLDMFRNPKMAAYVYASQGEQEDVLHVSSSMDIGEHPAGFVGDVYVFSNADHIDLYKNDEFVRRFEPDREDYPNLPHPPFVINDFIGELIERNYGISTKSSDAIKKGVQSYGEAGGIVGLLKPNVLAGMGAALVRDRISFNKAYEIAGKYVMNWGSDVTTYRFEAIKNDVVVKTVTKTPMTEFKLGVEADHTDLVENTTYDVATINIEALSGEDNLLNFSNEVVTLKTRGPIEIIGPKAVALRGGMGGTYVKTKGRNGKASLVIQCDRCDDIEIDFQVKVNK